MRLKLIEAISKHIQFQNFIEHGCIKYYLLLFSHTSRFFGMPSWISNLTAVFTV